MSHDDDRLGDLLALMGAVEVALISATARVHEIEHSLAGGDRPPHLRRIWRLSEDVGEVAAELRAWSDRE